MLTQQTFELIAKVVSEHERDRHQVSQLRRDVVRGVISSDRAADRIEPLLSPLAERFADELERTNPLFNRQRFIEACANLNETPTTTEED